MKIVAMVVLALLLGSGMAGVGRYATAEAPMPGSKATAGKKPPVKSSAKPAPAPVKSPAKAQPKILKIITKPSPAKQAVEPVKAKGVKKVGTPQIATIATASPMSHFDILQAVVNKHRQRHKLPLLGDEEFAQQVLRYDYGFYIDALARKRDDLQAGKPPAVTWDIIGGFLDLAVVKKDVETLTEGWTTSRVIAAAHGIAYGDLVGNIGGENITAGILLVAEDTTLKNVNEMLLLGARNGSFDAAFSGAPQGSAALPALGMPSSKGIDSEYIKNMVNTLKSVGGTISGNYCGVGWQTNAMLQGIGGTSSPASTAPAGTPQGIPSEGGGSGGPADKPGGTATTMGTSCGGGANTSVSLCGGDPHAALCGGGVDNSLAMDSGGSKDKPEPKNNDQINTKVKIKDPQGDNVKNAGTLVGQTQSNVEKANNNYKNTITISPGESFPTKTEVAAVQDDLNTANAQNEGANKLAEDAAAQAGLTGGDAGEVTGKGSAKQAAKLKAQIAAAQTASDNLQIKLTQDTGPGVEAAGAESPYCRAGGFDAAAYCGVGGAYVAMKYVYKEDVWGDSISAPDAEQVCKTQQFAAAGSQEVGGGASGELEPTKPVGIDGKKQCDCKADDLGQVVCSESLGYAGWGIDWSKIVPFLPDVSPEQQLTTELAVQQLKMQQLATQQGQMQQAPMQQQQSGSGVSLDIQKPSSAPPAPGPGTGPGEKK